MRFLLDEMLPPSIAVQLRSKGLDAVAVVEVPELLGAPDADVLAAAQQAGRVLVTENIGDFVRLDREWASMGRHHSGILLVSTSRYPYGAARIGAIVTALQKFHRAATTVPSPLDFL